MDPFRPVPQADGVLYLVTDLQAKADPEAAAAGEKEDQLNFSLDLPDLRQMRKAGQEVELRMLRSRPLMEDGAEIEQIEHHRLHQAWPRSLVLEVNGREVFRVKPPKRTTKRRDVPQSISANLKPGSNRVKITVDDECPGDFVLAVVRASPVPPRELAKFARRVSYEESLERVKSLLFQRPSGDEGGVDGVACVGDERLQLRCPVTLVRPTLPSRGQACRHLQCFDLEAYMVSNWRTRAFNNRWRCPVCDAELRPKDLRVDAFLQAILQATEEVDEEVLLSSDGSWRRVEQQPNEEGYESSDDVYRGEPMHKAVPTPQGARVIEEKPVDKEKRERLERRKRRREAWLLAGPKKKAKKTKRKRQIEGQQEPKEGDTSTAAGSAVRKNRKKRHKHQVAQGGSTPSFSAFRRQTGLPTGLPTSPAFQQRSGLPTSTAFQQRSVLSTSAAFQQRSVAVNSLTAGIRRVSPVQQVRQVIRTIRRRPLNVPPPKGAIDLDSDAPPEELSDSDANGSGAKGSHKPRGVNEDDPLGIESLAQEELGGVGAIQPGSFIW